jgi:hypothetical protein
MREREREREREVEIEIWKEDRIREKRKVTPVQLFGSQIVSFCTHYRVVRIGF